MQTIPFGEFLPDQQDFGGGSSRALNVYPTVRGYNSFPSIAPMSDALDGLPLGAYFARSRSGEVRAFAGTQNTLYELGMTVEDLSKDGGYSTTDGNRWDFFQFDDLVITCNFFDPTQVKELGSNTKFRDLLNAPRARAGSQVRDFVMFGNTNDPVDGVRSNRVIWSGFNAPEEYIPGTNQSDFQDLKGNGGEIQRIFGGEYAVIIQERSIWRAQYVGGSIIFQFDEVERGRGTTVPSSCVQFGRSIYYLGRDGFYELVDGSYSKPIGAEKVDRFFLSDFDTNYRYSMSATVDPVRNIVIWTYPGAGNSNGIPNRSLIYNWETGRWSLAEFNSSMQFYGGTLSFSLDELDQFGTLDNLPFSLDSRVWNGGNEFLAGFTADNRFGFFDGTALPAEIDSAEIGGYSRNHIQAVRPHIQGDANTVVTVQVGGRNQLTESVVFDPVASLDVTGKANVRNKNRYQRIRVSIEGGFQHANEIDVKTAKGGRR